ncbi:MAG TPA: hypothetical protein VMY39_10925, partial [Planctomycetota bacterium]|nr:hypothetical protein [Planctomycetota bacterium]
MVRHRWYLYGVVAAALALNVACWVWVYHRGGSAPPQAVRVISSLPGDEADGADRLTLVFDREVVSRSRVGEVEPAAPFEVSPAWPGQWRWAGPETLQFLLEKPLPPGRVFTLTATDALPRRFGMTLEGEKTFRFRTRALELTSCQIRTSSPEEATFELVFNQPVDPDELLRRLRVYDRREAPTPAPRTADAPDAAMPADLAESPQLSNLIGLTKTPAERLVIRSARPRSGGLAFVLDRGLTGHEGELPLGRDEYRTLVISPRLWVVRAWASEPGLEETLWVRVRFTHALKTGQKLPELAVDPPVEGLRHHVSDDELVLSGKFAPGRRYVVKVPGTLVDRDGGTLGEDQQVAVSIDSRRPSLAIPYWSGVLSPHGNLLLEMKVVNISSVELSAWRVHPNNLVYYLAERNKRTTSRALFERTFRLDVPPQTPQTVALDLRKLL